MIKRLFIYLSEMFPLPQLLGSFLTTLTCQALILLLNNKKINFFDHEIWLISICVFLFSLLIRIMDEFKDYEDDLKNFPQRPLPSGRVLKADLKVLGLIVGILPVVVSFILGPEAFIACLIVMFYSLLMLKWFFCEKAIRSSLPLALVTHHPIVILHFVFLISAVYSSYGLVEYTNAIPLISLMFLFTNWEVSRKIRYPENETAYTTYSKIWGMKNALLVAMLLMSIVYIGSNFLLGKIGTSAWVLLIYNFGFISIMLNWIRAFRGQKCKKTFKEYAELLILFCFLTIFVNACYLNTKL